MSQHAGLSRTPFGSNPDAAASARQIRIQMPALSNDTNIQLNNIYRDSRYKRWKELDASEPESVKQFVDFRHDVDDRGEKVLA